MRVLISTEHDKSTFPSYLILRNLTTLGKLITDKGIIVDRLVIYKSDEQSEVSSATLTRLFSPNSVELILVEPPTTQHPALRVTVLGLGGVTYQDEYIVRDEQTLDKYLSATSSSGKELTVVSDVNVVAGFLDALEQGTPIPAPRRELVKRSTNNLMTALEVSQREKEEQARAAVMVLANAVNSTTHMEGTIQNLRAKLDKIATALQTRDSASTTTSGVGVGLTYFPPVHYSGSKPIHKVKCVGSMKYLVSFMLGYYHYLLQVHNIRTRLVFVQPTGSLIQQRYASFTWVKGDTPLSDSSLHEPVLFTNQPTGKLMKNIIEDSKFNAVIVVDLTQNTPAHVVKTAQQRVVYAVEGISAANELSLPHKRCMSSVSQHDSLLLTVPTFTTYPSDKERRIVQYTSLRAQYDTLFKALQG